jgi:lipopolysaccharide transport system permease protein
MATDHLRFLPSEVPITRIRPLKGWMPLHLGELWEYRDLLRLLAWRDIKVRYKQTALGAAWAVLQPLLTMAVFSLFFGKLAKIPSDGLPYPVFAFAALVPWGFFSTSLAQASNSLVGNANLIQKVYFPRLVVPISCAGSALVDMCIAFLVLLGFMVGYRIVPSIHAIWLPAFVVLALITSLGAGLWLSALNVRYRDVRYVVPFLLQFWLFATPIAYPSSLLHEPWRTVYGLNPMVGVVEGFRWALLDAKTAPGAIVAASALAALTLLVTGALYFRRMEATFADVV